MEFTNDGNMNGGGGFGSGLAIGGLLNRRDDNNQWIWAVIIFAIIFIIALVFLALAFRDKGNHRNDSGVSEIIAATIAAKGANNDCHGNGYHQLYEKLDNNEVKSGIAGVKSEVGALGLYLSKNASDYEMKNLEQFGAVKEQLGALNQGMTLLLQEKNNEAIAFKVAQMFGYGSSARCA